MNAEMADYVFDASGILVAVRELGEEAVNVLLGSYTVSLVFYEVANAIWKEFFLLRRAREERVIELLKEVFSIIG